MGRLFPYNASRGMVLVLCRICCACYCAAMGILHIIMGSIPEARAAMRISQPYTTAAVFSMLGLMHGYGLVNLFRPSKSASKNKNTVVPTSGGGRRSRSLQTMYETYLSADGHYGRRGAKYEVRLMVREMIEIPSQSYQAYLMCLKVPNGYFALVYASIIFADCLLVPIIMQIKKIDQLKRRNRVLVIDLIVDTILGAIYPLATAMPAARSYLSNREIVTWGVWLGEVLSSTQYFVVTSAFQLFLAAIPLLFSHLLIETIHLNWCDIAKRSNVSRTPCKIKNIQNAVVPNLSKTIIRQNSQLVGVAEWLLSIIEVVFSIGIVLWGIVLMYFVVAAIYRPTCSSEFANASCKSMVHPWFSKESDCNCIVIDWDCMKVDPMKNQTSFFNYSDALEQTFNPLTPLIFHIVNCKFTEAPKALETYTSLFELRISHSAMNKFEVQYTDHQNLFVLHLEYNNLEELPRALYNLPPALYYLGLDYTNIRSFPDSVLASWTSVSALALSGNSLRELPSAVYHLPNLRQLIISNNYIESLPDQISLLQNLTMLDVANNSLHSMSPHILDLSYLSWISLELNNLKSLPWSKSTILNWPGTLQLNYNPICSKSHSLQIQNDTSCKNSCSPLCHDEKLKNFKCDAACNTQECNHDNGICVLT